MACLFLPYSHCVAGFLKLIFARVLLSEILITWRISYEEYFPLLSIPQWCSIQADTGIFSVNSGWILAAFHEQNVYMICFKTRPGARVFLVSRGDRSLLATEVKRHLVQLFSPKNHENEYVPYFS